MVADGAERYLSTLFNDKWMEEQSFSLSVDSEMLRATARELMPWSDQPQACSNYRMDLINTLSVPGTTLKMNQNTVNRSFVNEERSGIID